MVVDEVERGLTTEVVHKWQNTGGKGGGRCGVGGTVNRVRSGRWLSLIGGFSSSTVVFGLFHWMVDK